MKTNWEKIKEAYKDGNLYKFYKWVEKIKKKKVTDDKSKSRRR